MTFEEIDRLAVKISEIIRENEIIAINGDLGTGKTTLVKKIAKQLGIKDEIRSPTFTLVQEYYSGRVPLFHFDVYRLSKTL